MKKAIALLILGACSSAHAAFYNGNELLERLNDPARVYLSMGYIAGVADMGAGEYHCAPPEVTLGQLRDMMHRSLTITPSTRHMNAAFLVTATLMDTWPCPKQQKGKNL